MSEMTMVERVAKSIYNLDPFYEPGEYVDGFLVSPGGNISWEQALARDAEFEDDPRMGKVTEFAFKAAVAAILELRVPTPEMLAAANASWQRRLARKVADGTIGKDHPDVAFTENWQAMIDAALAQYNSQKPSGTGENP